MGDVVVTRADREAVLNRKLGCFWKADDEFGRWAATGDLDALMRDVPLHEMDAWPYHHDAEMVARVRIAAERAGYERGVREERERCARYAQLVSEMIGRNSASHADAWVGKVASDIERGEHAKEGA